MNLRRRGFSHPDQLLADVLGRSRRRSAALSGVIVSSGVAPGGTDGKSGGDPEQYGPGHENHTVETEGARLKPVS